MNLMFLSIDLLLYFLQDIIYNLISKNNENESIYISLKVLA